jgi:hypothetical protein
MRQLTLTTLLLCPLVGVALGYTYPTHAFNILLWSTLVSTMLMMLLNRLPRL